MSDDLHPQHDLDPDVLAALEADLSSPALWLEPPAALEDDIVAAITAEVEQQTPRSAPAPVESRPRWLWAVAAFVLLAGGFGLGAALTGDGDGDTTEVAGEVFALDSTELAGDGTGTVELAVLANGLWIMLDLQDLPPAPEGQFYEAWVIRPEGVVSAGTFHMRNQTGSIVLWAGVVPGDGSAFSITLEDDDSNTASSGRVVLRADVGALTDA